MFLRRLHRNIGIIFAPFFLLTAVAGALLLLRKTGIYSPEAHDTIFGLHNWEIVADYVGIAFASALGFMAVTGSLIFFKMKIAQRRRSGKV